MARRHRACGAGVGAAAGCEIPAGTLLQVEQSPYPRSCLARSWCGVPGRVPGSWGSILPVVTAEVTCWKVCKLWLQLHLSGALGEV